MVSFYTIANVSINSNVLLLLLYLFIYFYHLIFSLHAEYCLGSTCFEIIKSYNYSDTTNSL